MVKLNDEEMASIKGGIKWPCVGIAAFALLAATNPISGLAYLAAGVVAGCFD